MCEFMTVNETAEALTVSRATVYRLIQSKKLVSISITGAGGCIRLTRESVDAYKAQLISEARGVSSQRP